jgi:hypothetical protein
MVILKRFSNLFLVWRPQEVWVQQQAVLGEFLPSRSMWFYFGCFLFFYSHLFFLFGDVLIILL